MIIDKVADMTGVKPDRSVIPLPDAILFDWHGTLVNTLDAMYKAIEDMLPRLEELGLVDQMVPETMARSRDDEKLIRYIRIFRKLHPRVLAERRVSRTEIFDALFGDNEQAKAVAHRAYIPIFPNHSLLLIFPFFFRNPHPIPTLLTFPTSFLRHPRPPSSDIYIVVPAPLSLVIAPPLY